MSWIQAFTFTLVCLLGAVRTQSGLPRGRQVLNPLGRPIIGDDVIGDEIPGVAGVDYPVLASVPPTDFRCDQLPYPGYYADQQAYCQVFYICERGGRGTGFLCPNGTLFNQEFLVCDWWNHVDCARAVDFYSVNEAVVRAMEEVDAAKLSRSPLDGSLSNAFFNSRGEPLSAARIPGGRSSNYNPLGLDRPFVSPAVRSRLINRYPTNNGRVPNAALFDTTPRPVSKFPNAFNNYRPLNGLGPLNNNYAYPSQNTLGGLSNRYPYRPQNPLGAFNNRYQALPLGAFNNRYPARPLGAFNNRYPTRPQAVGEAIENGYKYGPPGVGNAFNDGFNGLDGRNNNPVGNSGRNKDDGRNAINNGGYNRGNENSNSAKDAPDNGKYTNGNKGGNDAERNNSDKQTQGNNGDTLKEYNDGDQGRERYRDEKGSDKGYFYDRPKNEFKGDGQDFGVVDPSKSYLPPLK